MPSPLASLLHRSLDFAGLFPPAALPVAEAVGLFRKEQAADAAQLLARFVCPIPRLEELLASGAGGGDQPAISVLPRGGKNGGEFLANLETDLAAIQRLARLHETSATIDTLELRPPADALSHPATFRKLLAAVDALIRRHESGIRQIFVELAPAPELASQLESLAEWGSLRAERTDPIIGYKLRTGGSDTVAAPASALVANALAAAATLRVAMKCTGGLHRPLHAANAAGGSAHGFVNLLMAGVVAAAGRTDPSLLESILAETEPSAFTFDSRSVAWRDQRFTPAAVSEARRRLLLSFGSCYADQPRLELQKLGWWPRNARVKSVAAAN